MGPGDAVRHDKTADKICVILATAETVIGNVSAAELHGREYHAVKAREADLCRPVRSIHAGRNIVVVNAIQARAQMVQHGSLGEEVPPNAIVVANERVVE